MSIHLEVEELIEGYLHTHEIDAEWDYEEQELIIPDDTDNTEKHAQTIADMLEKSELVPGGKSYYHEGTDSEKQPVYKIGMFRLDS
jgi:hypothetical protein